MTLLFFTAAALLFYSTSKYFPFSGVFRSVFPKTIRGVTGIIIGVLGIFLLSLHMPAGTALIVGLVMIMTLLPLLIFSLTMYPRSWIGWTVVLAIITLIDLFRYAG